MLIYTDGSCNPNPGEGGWAYVIYMDGAELTYRVGLDPQTTNNRMEMMAAIMALENTVGPCTIITDSQLLLKGATEWHKNWIKRQWRNVKNVDLWQRLLAAINGRDVKWKWVRGHNGDACNERADLLALLAREMKI